MHRDGQISKKLCIEMGKSKESMQRYEQNQRNYSSRWAKSKKLCVEIGKIKEIMHRDGQNQRNYASRWAIDIQVVKT